MLKKSPRCMLCLLVLAFFCPRSGQTAESRSREDGVQAGVAFLKAAQNDDGTWTSPDAIGVTGLVAHALLASDVPVDDPAVQKSLKAIEKHVQPDGGIYHAGSSHKNYETSIVLLALTSANADGRYTDTIERAVAFLKNLQWDDDESAARENPAFGGAGYGSHARPDLSNTAFFLDALKAAGSAASDPAMQNALVFVSRCQNLAGPNNDTPFAEKINDGGFYYTPAAGGSSQAGTTADGGLRSYASMTYAGLRSMIYAGLTPDDPRVKAAEDWMRKFYSLNENPGMGQQGLFYYYQTFAKTMEALGNKEFIDASGKHHVWADELTAELLKRQQPNGSWVNPTPRWMEGDPNLVTAYALLALDRCGKN